jgi:hypothetical protein
MMDKYKDFEDLPNNYSKQDLMNLFVKRNYSRRIESPKADDIIIIDDPRDGFTKIAGKPNIPQKVYTKISSYDERMRLKETSKIVMYQFPENNDIESAKFEVSILKPLEVEDYYTRKKVKAYLIICRKIINEEKTLEKKKVTFEQLFRDKDNAKKVKEIFELKGYIINGKWHGLTDNKSELSIAYYVLKPLLKAGLKDTPTAKIFYSEFGLPEGYISDRMLRNEPVYNDILTEFEQIFSNLLKPLK